MGVIDVSGKGAILVLPMDNGSLFKATEQDGRAFFDDLLGKGLMESLGISPAVFRLFSVAHELGHIGDERLYGREDYGAQTILGLEERADLFAAKVLYEAFGEKGGDVIYSIMMARSLQTVVATDASHATQFALAQYLQESGYKKWPIPSAFLEPIGPEEIEAGMNDIGRWFAKKGVAPEDGKPNKNLKDRVELVRTGNHEKVASPFSQTLLEAAKTAVGYLDAALKSPLAPRLPTGPCGDGYVKLDL